MTNRDLKNHAYHILKEKLINCEYKPGTMLNETQLSQELGFSRTPIREALNRIEQEGFIRILPKKGIYVTEFSLADVMQIFQARLEVEPVALRMAGPVLPKEELRRFQEKFLDRNQEEDVRNAFRLDTAMHLFIIEHCGNRFIIDMMYKVFNENTRVIISSKQNEIQIHDARQEHTDIINLLLEDRYDQAQEAMRKHIESCRQAALHFFYNMPSYPIQSADLYKVHLDKIPML